MAFNLAWVANAPLGSNQPGPKSTTLRSNNAGKRRLLVLSADAFHRGFGQPLPSHSKLGNEKCHGYWDRCTCGSLLIALGTAECTAACQANTSLRRSRARTGYMQHRTYQGNGDAWRPALTCTLHPPGGSHALPALEDLQHRATSWPSLLERLRSHGFCFL